MTRGPAVTADEVVLVDRDDNPRGAVGKLAAHQAPGLLHRAVSVVLWAPHGQVVLQRRAWTKYHFAGLWSNSCCTHPRPGEAALDTAGRRTADELGTAVAGLAPAGRFRYSARDDASGLVEHELVHVFAGRLAAPLDPDRHEVADVELVDVDALRAWYAREPEAFSPWFAAVMRNAAPDLWAAS